MRKLIFIFLFIFSLNASEFICDGCDTLKNGTYKRVYVSNPTLLYSLYSFDKNLPIALNFEFWPIEKKYLDPKFYKLPVVGGFFGQGKTPNLEKVLSLNPDLIICATNAKKNPKYIRFFDSLKIPNIYLEDEDIFQRNLYKFYGELFDNEKRANELISYADKSALLAKQIEDMNLSKPNVYYAYGKDGLRTECGSSSFTKLVDLAGGNSAKFACKSQSKIQRVKVNFEEILLKNPDIILVYHKDFYEQIYKDPKWAPIKAVKEKRVYLIPRAPFSWVGKPASFTKILGFKWLVSKLHSDEFDINIRNEARDFYKVFFYTDLSDEDLDFILNAKNEKN